MNTTTPNEADLTPWFDGLLHKPARPGVYMRRLGDYVVYGWWTGSAWRRWFWKAAEAANDALRSKGAPPKCQNPDWRGLRNKP